MIKRPMFFELKLIWGLKSYGFQWFWIPRITWYQLSKATPPRRFYDIKWLQDEAELGIYG